MMKQFLIAVCLLFASMTASNAFFIVEQFTPEKVDSVSVVISDGAVDGCWTNLGEAKRYAEDKLELAGFTVRSTKDDWTPKGYQMAISVTSSRSNGCFGSVSFQIYQPNWIDGVFGHFEVGNGGSVFTGAENANQTVLKYLRRFFDALPK